MYSVGFIMCTIYAQANSCSILGTLTKQRHIHTMYAVSECTWLFGVDLCSTCSDFDVAHSNTPELNGHAWSRMVEPQLHSVPETETAHGHSQAC
jgi:hypothetical protein